MKTIINSFRQIQKYDDIKDILEQAALMCFFGVAVVASVGYVV
jgi:hypothetical protein